MVFRNGIDTKTLMIIEAFHTQKVSSNNTFALFSVSIHVWIFDDEIIPPILRKFRNKNNLADIRRKRSFGRSRGRWEDNIIMDLQEVGCGGVTGSSWLRIGTGGGHLWMLEWTFGFRKMRGISWLSENRIASQEGLYSNAGIRKGSCGSFIAVLLVKFQASPCGICGGKIGTKWGFLLEIRSWPCRYHYTINLYYVFIYALSKLNVNRWKDR